MDTLTIPAPAATPAPAAPIRISHTRRCARALYGNAYMRQLCRHAAIQLGRQVHPPEAQVIEAKLV